MYEKQKQIQRIWQDDERLGLKAAALEVGALCTHAPAHARALRHSVSFKLIGALCPSSLWVVQ